MAGPLIAQLIGGAGTGKTRALMDVLAKVIDEIHDPMLVGFVSFTRAACDEAADRASDMLNQPRSRLRDTGWFKTMHGVCYRALGAGKELLTDNAESRTWLEETFGISLARAEALNSAIEEPLPGWLEIEKNDSAYIGVGLNLWSTARNRLEPLRKAWERVSECNPKTPDYSDCLAVVERYEQAKRLDGRCDFVDLLTRFAGWRCTPEGAERCSPEGEPPRLTAWMHDECQDSSNLLDSCFRRLIDAPGVRWVYIAGDPFQSIFGWSGADHRCFLNYHAAKRRVMPKSHRCAAEILALGERILSECSDYWYRGIEPVGPGGEIEDWPLGGAWIEDVDPRESWLLLARTNFQALRLARMLDERAIPWQPTRKAFGCRWQAPARTEAIRSLLSLQRGGPVDGAQWQRVLDFLPATVAGEALLERGTKAEFARMEGNEASDKFPWVQLDALSELGASTRLKQLVASGGWTDLIDTAADYVAAVERFGEGAVLEPKVRVGTIHSAKGLEADNVALVTTTSGPCQLAAETVEGADEDARLKYVAVTRARTRLWLLNEQTARFRWSFPL